MEDSLNLKPVTLSEYVKSLNHEESSANQNPGFIIQCGAVISGTGSFRPYSRSPRVVSLRFINKSQKLTILFKL
jgi:hypothetical protein